MKRLLLLLLLLSLPCLASAESILTDGAYRYKLVNGGAYVAGYTPAETPEEIIVPATLGGYPVTGVAPMAFYNANGEYDGARVRRLVLPDGVRVLERNAFECAHDVREIVLPGSVEEIAENCFTHVTAELTYSPENDRYANDDGFLIDTATDTLLYVSPSAAERPLPRVRRLGEGCLFNWETGDAPVLPDTLREIGTRVFYDQASISLTIPDGVTRLDRMACNTELDALSLPSTLKSIGAYCFSGAGLTAVSLPDGVEFVGFNAFDEGVLVIASAETHFQTEAEYNAEQDYAFVTRDGGAYITRYSLAPTTAQTPEEIIVPAFLDGQPVVGLAADAFNNEDGGYEGEQVRRLVLPDGLRVLDDSAFRCCHGVQAIDLPASLERIAEGCFFHVSAELTLPDGCARYVLQDGFLIDAQTNTLLYVNPSAADKPLPRVRRLGDFCLQNWHAGSSPALPDTLREIGTGCLYDLPDVTSLVLPEGLTRLDDFSCYLPGLRALSLPATLTYIGEGCFDQTALTEITLPAGLTFLGKDCFTGVWVSYAP